MDSVLLGGAFGGWSFRWVELTVGGAFGGWGFQWVETLSTWLQALTPGPQASLSSGFETAAGPDAGCCAGVRLSGLKNIQEVTVSSPRL